MKNRATHTRRDALKQSLAVAGWLAGAGLLPGTASAQLTPSDWNAAAFGAHSFETVLEALGAARPTLSDAVVLTIPDLADNGAAVPAGVSTALPGVQRLALLVEKNPTVLLAVFDLSDAIDANVALRIKMAESSNVYAVAMLADGRVFYSVKDVKVTLGGCGG
ncbi:MAG: thiosulfate oxidation carrier protein SoxY [Burkholderiaceae bacterium]|nr:thiosulfate oxidation carrier protein SoxY [Burkholderiaceae bacterium]